MYLTKQSLPPTRVVAPMTRRIWSVSELDKQPGVSSPLRHLGLLNPQTLGRVGGHVAQGPGDKPPLRDLFPELWFHLLPADPGHRA